MIDLAALVADPARAAAVPRENIPALLGDLERLRAELWARLAGGPNHRDNGTAATERPYTLNEAAGLLVKGAAWLRRHAKAGRVPGARKVGRSWVFDRAKFDHWRARPAIG